MYNIPRILSASRYFAGTVGASSRTATATDIIPLGAKQSTKNKKKDEELPEGVSHEKL